MYVYISVAPVTVIFAVNGLRVTKVGNEGELLQGSSKGIFQRAGRRAALPWDCAALRRIALLACGKGELLQGMPHALDSEPLQGPCLGVRSMSFDIVHRIR